MAIEELASGLKQRGCRYWSMFAVIQSCVERQSAIRIPRRNGPPVQLWRVPTPEEYLTLAASEGWA